MNTSTLAGEPGVMVDTAASNAAPRAKPSPASPERSDAEIIAGLNVVIAQEKPPPAYGVAMGLLAFCVLLLPLAYVAFVGFLAYLTVWHFYQTFASLQYGPYFVFHLPMALLSGLLLLFLVKPLFLRNKDGNSDVITLSRAEEPLLFAFVERLCRATGARTPEQIEVDCEPNAAARISKRFVGLVGGRLVLRIGLPLASGLTARQFAGVIGHELGHFNQRSGMTGSYVIRRLNHFLARVVFQRDRLDLWLERRRHSPNVLAKGFYYLAVVLVEPARGVLWLTHLGGELLTCHVLRRMEYDADRVEAELAGVRDFIHTSRQLTFLSLAGQMARGDLANAFDRRRLADDFPRLIAANAQRLTRHRDDIFKSLDEQKTGWLDTHPAHADRVRNVQRLRPDGALAIDAPAERLFADFDALCRRGSRAFYESVVGAAALADVALVPTGEVVADRAAQTKEFGALERFFRGQVVGSRPIFPGPDARRPLDDADAGARALADAREAMLRAADTLGPAAEEYREANGIIPLARAQVALCDLFRHVPKTVSMRAKAQGELRRCEPLKASAIARLATFEALARTRLTMGLRLLASEPAPPNLGTADEVAAARASVDRLIGLCDRLGPTLPIAQRLFELSGEVEVLFSAYNDDQPYPPLVDKILAATHGIVSTLGKLRTELADVPYPFAHGTAGVSIGLALVPDLPDEKDPPDVHSTAIATLDRFATTVFRTLAGLTELAERAEAAVGMAPLEEMPDAPTEEDAKSEAQQKKQSAKEKRNYWLGYGGRATAGVGLLAAIVMLSIAPPNLPSMPWESATYARDAHVRYRPASFSMASGNYAAPPPPPTFYDPRSNQRTAFYPPNFPTAGYPQPGYPQGYGVGRQPGVGPGAFPANGPRAGQNQPGMPGSPYRPGGAPSPYAPNTPSRSGGYNNGNGSGYNPRPNNGGGYNPGGGGGYNPGGRSGAGGGGYSPGGGGGGRR